MIHHNSSSLVLLDDIVEIFRLNDTDDPTSSREFEDDIEALQASQIGTALVDGNTMSLQAIIPWGPKDAA